MSTKKILAISDLSCVGKCSLTVTLPVASALGCEVSVIPTALLSTHTGGFKNYYFKNLSDDLKAITDHLKSQSIKFDCIYTGYLLGNSQVDAVMELIGDFKADSGIVVVDPVMADHGKLYANFESDYPSHILKLCKMANYILPNLTESLFLTGDTVFDDATVEKLKQICNSFAVTSIIKNGQTGVFAYDGNIDESGFYGDKTIEGIYHGAGDLYSSAVCGCLVSGIDFLTAAALSKKFVYKSIERTNKSRRDTRYGLLFEEFIADFALEVKSRT